MNLRSTLISILGDSDVRNRLLYIALLFALAGSMWVFWYRWPILYPYTYFNHSAAFEGFTVYSDEPIDSSFAKVMRNVRLRMTEVEGYDPEESFPVFVCYSRSCYERFARQMGVNSFSQGMTMEPMGYPVVNLYDIRTIEKLFARPYPYTLAHGDPAHIIAHELVHLITTERLGIWKTVTLPTWKEEGYAEYAASIYPRKTDPDYSLRARAQQYLNNYYLGIGSGRLEYVKAGLAVEYLLDEQGISFEALMDGESELELSEVLAEMETWAQDYDSTK